MVIMSIPFAFAVESSDADDDAVQFISVGHGEFKLSKSNSFYSNRVNDSANTSKGDTIAAYPTSDEEILETSDGRYLTHAYDDSYLLTSKIDIDVDNLEQYRSVFERNDISDELYVDIENTIAAQKALGNENLLVEIYVPSLVNSNEPSTATRAGTTTVSGEYIYSSPGRGSFRLKDYTVKFVNCQAGPKVWGDKNAVTSAKLLTDIVVQAAGVTIVPFSVFGAGKSLYDQYIKKYNVVVDSYVGNTITTSVVYDRLEKETKVFRITAQDFLSGKTSHKIWLNYMHNDFFRKSTGKYYIDDTAINRSYYSKYWDDGEAAINESGAEQFLKLKVRDTIFYLNGK